jgi:hypothetical protein
VHLSRRLGARRHLELDFDAVDRVRLTGRGDVQGGHDQTHLSGRCGLAQPCPDLSLRAAGQRSAVQPARRPMAVPAYTFSATACSVNPTGAITWIRPESTSLCDATPKTPPKWSTWLWV